MTKKKVTKPVTKKKTRRKKKNAAHYVDNEEFLVAMVAWKVTLSEAESSGASKPGFTVYNGKWFSDIETQPSYRPNFIGYSYREDMISDVIENCLMYCYNFDPAKSSNPFSYFTQIIYYAFLRRIQKEKKQQYIKFRCFEAASHRQSFVNWARDNNMVDRESENVIRDYLRLTATDIANFDAKIKPKRRKKKTTPKKKRTTRGTLDGAFDEEKE